jgi:hypothetical protein
MVPNGDLGSRLISQEAMGLDARTLATVALLRQRRRIRLLAGGTVGLWFLAAAVIPAFLMPMHAAIEPKVSVMAKHVATGDERATPEVVAGALLALYRHMAFAFSAAAVVSTVCSLLAAVATVWLVMTVRRNTLDQVNLGLAEVSEQLRRLGGK